MQAGESRDDSEVGGFAFAGDDIVEGAPDLTVRVGEPVTVTLTNVHGQYFGEAGVVHDFAVVADKEGTYLTFEPLWGARTAVLRVGETETITFTPDMAGRYYWVCTVGDHIERGMWGEFIVEG